MKKVPSHGYVRITTPRPRATRGPVQRMSVGDYADPSPVNANAVLNLALAAGFRDSNNPFGAREP